ncbi:hypothetical protein MP228_006542 [Amoeboaphelidium protococcarum]|nr:hypothetical protein MP228_006542 [Amoeboaphelidium protococcarum]
MKANQLIKEKSPYLLQHAYNPVEWYPWGQKAFELAKQQDKAIFLSIGYTTCHWCHVMQHESFEDEKTAEIMSKYFINIKVDREELPDVDSVYMTFVQATSGRGGWPLSCWLTPELKPFYGGTYFPPRNHYGRPSFINVCELIQNKWTSDRSKLLTSADNVYLQLKQALRMESTQSAGAISDLNAWKVANKCFKYYQSHFDSEYGGFTPEPKFPTPSIFQFLFAYHRSVTSRLRELSKISSISSQDIGQYELARKLGFDDQSSSKSTTNAEVYLQQMQENAESAKDMALFTLKKIAHGGIHDHVAKGFHRYSTDNRWHVPHFEKMLYDQAQLLVAYSNAYSITKDQFYLDIVRDICEYMNRDLGNKDGEHNGGYYCAEDADSYPHIGAQHKLEGAFAVWTKSEVDQALGQDAEMVCEYYGVKQDGNVRPDLDIQGELNGKNVLILDKDVKAEDRDVMDQCLKKLYGVRQQRPKPHLDDKILTAWNGLAIYGLVSAYNCSMNKEYLDNALNAAKFIKNNMVNADGELIRSYREGPSDIGGSCSDYAFLIQGLLALYQSTFQSEWLDWAVSLQRKQDELFYDFEHGGYYSSSDKSLLFELKEDHDAAEPSPNSMSMLNLLKLNVLRGDQQFMDKSKQTFHLFKEKLEDHPWSMPLMAASYLIQDVGLKTAVYVGSQDSQEFADLHQGVLKEHLPDVVLQHVKDGAEVGLLSELKKSGDVDEKAQVHVCQDQSCGMPLQCLDQILHEVYCE